MAITVKIGIISERAGTSGGIQGTGRNVAAAPAGSEHLVKRIKGKDEHCWA